jgi:aminomethyltransferase
MEGDDRLDLLQRMSTNDLQSLSPNHWKTTVLTNALARIVDRVSMLHGQDESYLVTSPGRGKVVQDWLQDFIFFQDDVRLEDESGQWSFWSVVGPQRMATLCEVFDHTEEPRVDEHAKFNGILMWGCARPLPSVRLLVPAKRHRSLRERSAARGDPNLNREVFEILRVEAGFPIHAREFSQDSIPLEVGLKYAIDFQKGCYIGQEIIARMHSRGQIPKKLVGLILEGEVPSASTVFLGEKDVGRATTVVHSPNLGWIALAVVKSFTLEQNRQLLVGDGRVPARVVELPFLEGV